MGIKGWLAIGAGLIATVVIVVKRRKKEDETYDRIQHMIHNVDLEGTEEETTEKIIDDIEKSFRETGLEEEADAYTQAQDVIDMINQNIAEELGTTVEELRTHGREELDKLKGLNMDEIFKKQEEFDRQQSCNKIVDNGSVLEVAKQQKEFEEKLKELHEKRNDPEWQAEQERLRKEAEEKKEAAWKRKVKKAVEQKNWYKLEELFDGKYAGGPWHPSPASVFSEACSHGDISEEFLKMAEDHYGKMWCYSGD